MKKKLYGIYIILLGLKLKYIKKNDQKALMDFMAKVTKYSSMVVLISLTLACTLPGASAITKEETAVQLDWKGGIPTPTPIAQELQTKIEVIDESNPLNLPTKETNVDEGQTRLVIDNGDFQSPTLSCQNIGCPTLLTQPYTTNFSGWTVLQDKVVLESVRTNKEQYLNLNMGYIERTIPVEVNSRYDLSFQVNNSMHCSPKKKELKVWWNDQEIMLITAEDATWRTFTLTLKTTDDPIGKLGIESLAETSCGASIDKVNMYHVSTIFTENRSTSQLPEPTPTPLPEQTPETVTSEETAKETIQPDGQIAEPTATPLPPELISTITGEAIKATPVPQPGELQEVTPSKYVTNSDGMDSLPGNAIDYRVEPEVTDNIVIFSGYIVTKIEPLVVQIWNLQGTSAAVASDAKYLDEECSTEHPTIFFRKPAPLGFRYTEEIVAHDWVYCVDEFKVDSTTEVPWKDGTIWTFNENDGFFDFKGDKLAGVGNEYEEVDKWVIVVIGSEGLISRREVQN